MIYSRFSLFFGRTDSKAGPLKQSCGLFPPSWLARRRANPSPCNSVTLGCSQNSTPDLTQTGIRSKKHPLDRAAALPSILIAPCALSVHTIPEFRSNGYLTHPTNFSGVLHQNCQVVIAFPHCRVFFSFCLPLISNHSLFAAKRINSHAALPYFEWSGKTAEIKQIHRYCFGMGSPALSGIDTYSRKARCKLLP